MHLKKDNQIASSEMEIPLLKAQNNNDRFIFKPRKQYGWAKGFIIFLCLFAWAVGIGLCLAYNEVAQKEQEAAQPQEEIFDWKPIPDKKSPA